jgi:hypothetical protein
LWPFSQSLTPLTQETLQPKHLLQERTVNFIICLLKIKLVRPFCLFLLSSWIVSCRTTTPSKIYLTGRRADWEGLVILHATVTSMLV